MAEWPDPEQVRKPDYNIERLFIRRWSPRAMSGERISHDELMTLFEAARWAPSTYNEQEWRFLYAHRETENWQLFFDLLVEANQVWCRQAGVLVMVLSHKYFTQNGKPNPVNTFDTGLATQNLFLQATAMNLVAHGMAGIDRDKVRRDLGVPDAYVVEAGIAIGRPGNPADLPEPLRQREQPSGRNKVSQFVREGKFDF